MDNLETLLTTKEVFSLEDVDFGVNRLANGKAKDIEGYQAEILKIGGPVLIPHIRKRFSTKRSSKGSLNPGLRASLSLFLKAGIQITSLIIEQL